MSAAVSAPNSAPSSPVRRQLLAWSLALGGAAAAAREPEAAPATRADARTLRLDLGDAQATRRGFDSGFLMGLGRRDQPRLKTALDALSVAYWRVGTLDDAQYAARLGAKVTFGLGGVVPSKEPWRRWGEFERAITQTVEQARRRGIRVDYWEVWNEPDAKLFWPGTPEQFIEASVRAIRAIRRIDPQARVVGPSLSVFNPYAIDYYLDRLGAEGAQVDAISWHELGDDPRAMRGRVEKARAIAAARGLALEIHVNEFVSGPHHLIPAWNLAWLVAVLDADIDFASRACWERATGSGPSSECASGLNGLMTADESAMTPLGALYLEWARARGERHVVNQSMAGVTAFATTDAAHRRGRAMLARYSCGRQGRWCTFTERQAGDQAEPGTPVRLSLSSAQWAHQPMVVEYAVIENRDLEAAFRPGPARRLAPRADAQGRVVVDLVLEDGDVTVLHWRLAGAASDAVPPGAATGGPK